MADSKQPSRPKMTEAEQTSAASKPSGARVGKSAEKKRQASKQDDQVMGTNNSSITSKRSVEKIYYPDEPHFFRYFVKRFQRRAPLINRGYHLRMHLIGCAVRDFLSAPLAPGKRTKVVVNLGCGSDVLPWQCLTRYPDLCESAVFVDVDFPDLVLKKRAVVLDTPELRGPFAPLETVEAPLVLLRSHRYFQVGCDLRDVPSLESALASVVDLAQASFLFVAEVSITYMPSNSADAVIQWASTLGDSNFCLLEQVLPDGPQHPFAQTMMRHFERLNTPLKSIDKYQTLSDQKTRFLDRGWPRVECCSLWDAWSSGQFLPDTERRRLDMVEPFDEWEEFSLFGSHYMLLQASTSSATPAPTDDTSDYINSLPLPSLCTRVSFSEQQGAQGPRRFGRAMTFTDALGRHLIADVLGMGSNGRLRSIDLYTPDGKTPGPILRAVSGPSSRVCHSLTDLGEHSALLVGGRTSPSSPMADSWVFDKAARSWRRLHGAHELPVSLYRHTVIRLGHSSMVLVFGGKTGPSAIFDGYLLYHPDRGWIRCRVVGSSAPTPVFGALAFCSSGVPRGSTKFSGVYAGGIGEGGTIQDQVLLWELDVSDITAPELRLRCADAVHPSHRALMARFGASCVPLGKGFHLLAGGVDVSGLVRQNHDLVVLREEPCSDGFIACRLDISDPSIQRPLLIGSCTVACPGELVLLGGGATCFSMGTFWTKGTYTITFDPRQLVDLLSPSGQPQSKQDVSAFGAGAEDSDEIESWGCAETVTLIEAEGLTATVSKTVEPRPIPRVKLTSEAQFAQIVREGNPVVIERANIGPCTDKWTPTYMISAVGADREVVVHEAQGQVMDFNAKNFRYANKRFSELADEIERGGRLYLRALSSDEPTSRPANLQEDFPLLAGDFELPAEMALVMDNLFSSVLRMSGPVNMWLHYDVMANVYTQVRGSKRFLLFPPSDVAEMSIEAGGSSSSIDAFAGLDGGLSSQTRPQETVAGPGDVLYLPPFWLHTATPVEGTGASVAVNVFFRNQGEKTYAAGKDVYGNRDLAAYERGRKDVGRIIGGFEGVPADAREFYLLRLAQELRQGISP
ncbi:leucine carboxyl methyltransferase 2 [Magnaporthiopsis poae ATCC 64411]|uniref:tRNA wybutosine-synthesizing protein 4 n=1 Tax=Magnaporthiopsis poae (strain ATCC 64411 / 73-15) TaxID=644358 RepID=A0A0C4DLN6_MAGP6|nr:leucine carboxyl methyltransferase 2 [Magnaporthiopsis poae ATCC 64411]